ncbi:unnamed protein product [Discula destructiva]
MPPTASSYTTLPHYLRDLDPTVSTAQNIPHLTIRTKRGVLGGFLSLVSIVLLSALWNLYGWRLIEKLLKHESSYEWFLNGKGRRQQLWQRLVVYLENKAGTHSGWLRTATDQSPDMYLHGGSAPLQPDPKTQLEVSRPLEAKKCPPPPPTSFEDADWDHIEWDKFRCVGSTEGRDGKISSPVPKTPIFDHLSEPFEPPRQPSTVVEQARAKFQNDFSRGVQRLSTPGTGQLCSLYAAQLSISNQSDFKDVREPTMKELKTI